AAPCQTPQIIPLRPYLPSTTRLLVRANRHTRSRRHKSRSAELSAPKLNRSACPNYARQARSHRRIATDSQVRKWREVKTQPHMTERTAYQSRRRRMNQEKKTTVKRMSGMRHKHRKSLTGVAGSMAYGHHSVRPPRL
ncbi:uncharacterized protein PV07_12741, partial [Cladophialophora immunda]